MDNRFEMPKEFTPREWKLNQMAIVDHHRGYVKRLSANIKKKLTDEDIDDIYEKVMCQYVIDSAPLWGKEKIWDGCK